MAQEVNIMDMSKKQLRNAVMSLLNQLQNADATIKDLGVKVANREIENSRLRSVLEANNRASQQVPINNQKEAGKEEE